MSTSGLTNIEVKMANGHYRFVSVNTFAQLKGFVGDVFIVE